MSTHIVQRTIIAFVAVALIGNSLQGQIVEPGDFFFDDFEDGSFRDNDPVNWGRGAWSGAIEQIVNGDLEINGTRYINNDNDGISIFAPRNAGDTRYLSYDDAVYRTQGRISEVGAEETSIGFLARSAAPSGFFADIDRAGEIVLGESPVGGPLVTLGILQSAIDPVNNDVVLELVTAGSQLSFRVWEVGTSRPENPQLTATSDAFPFGTFGIYVRSPEPTPASASFRWASVSAIPEPATSTLLIGSLLVTACRVRSRR